MRPETFTSQACKGPCRCDRIRPQNRRLSPQLSLGFTSFLADPRGEFCRGNGECQSHKKPVLQQCCLDALGGWRRHAVGFSALAPATQDLS